MGRSGEGGGEGSRVREGMGEEGWVGEGEREKSEGRDWGRGKGIG